MIRTVFPGSLQGSITIPESKSELHRALICAALSGAPCEIRSTSYSVDSEATAEGLRALGSVIERRENGYYVNGIASGKPAAQIRCGESGSTLRFLLPVAAALGCGAVFFLGDRLKNRPMEPMLEVLQQGACKVERDNGVIRVEGTLRPGVYPVETTVSSQYLSGLLMSLPLLHGPTELLPDETIVSENYVNLTAAVMDRFGVTVLRDNGRYRTEGTFHEVPLYVPEGDWSAASFWIVANALGADITLSGLLEESVQGDRQITKCIRNIRNGGASVDLAGIPDLLPALAILASVTPGTTQFRNGSRLRGKESDRIDSVCRLLHALGGNCSEWEDGLTVSGVPSLLGGTAETFGDHRIAMAAAVAAIVCREPVTILGAECVEKSYPQFWNHFESLGGVIQ